MQVIFLSKIFKERDQLEDTGMDAKILYRVCGCRLSHEAQNKDKWRLLWTHCKVSVVIGETSFVYLAAISFWRRTLLHGVSWKYDFCIRSERWRCIHMRNFTALLWSEAVAAIEFDLSSLMMRTEMVLETSVLCIHLARLLSRENYLESRALH
jgi:hypothetical protein